MNDKVLILTSKEFTNCPNIDHAEYQEIYADLSPQDYDRIYYPRGDKDPKKSKYVKGLGKDTTQFIGY